jgi:hypothetical protein
MSAAATIVGGKIANTSSKIAYILLAADELNELIVPPFKRENM